MDKEEIKRIFANVEEEITEETIDELTNGKEKEDE